MCEKARNKRRKGGNEREGRRKADWRDGNEGRWWNWNEQVTVIMVVRRVMGRDGKK